MLAKLTKSPVHAMFALSTALAVCVALGAAIIGASVLATFGTSLAFLGVGAAMARSQAALAPVGAALALIGQAIAFTASFQGHPWQIDSHMMFFALLACLVSLRSIPALLTATVVIALHHLSLSFIMPSLIYPGGDFTGNLGRTVLHAVIVVMEAAALIATVHRLHRLNHRMAQQTSDLEDSLQQADQARNSSWMHNACKRQRPRAKNRLRSSMPCAQPSPVLRAGT